MIFGPDMDEENIPRGERNKPMKWNMVISIFVLKFLGDLVLNGIKTDKGFKEVHLEACAKALSKHVAKPVTKTQIVNHLRVWRKKWTRIEALRMLSGAHFDLTEKMIVLSDDHYQGHVTDHPEDAEFLNKPIEHYSLLSTIFAGEVATGKHGRDYATSLNSGTRGQDACSMKGVSDMNAPTEMNDVQDWLETLNATHSTPLTEQFEAGPSAGVSAGQSPSVASAPSAPSTQATGENSRNSSGSKRDRNDFSSDALLSVTDAMRSLASAVSADQLPSDLFERIMAIPGHSEDDLLDYYEYLSVRPQEAWGFYRLPEVRHRVRYIDRFLSLRPITENPPSFDD